MSYKSRRRLSQAVGTVIIIVLPFLNVLRLDVPTLRFYLFNNVLWVDEFHYLFLAVMLVLFVIVYFSMVYGRVWCGWVCPQIVLTELFYWFSRKTKQWFGVTKSGGKSTFRRAGAYLVISVEALVLSLLVGFNLVSYFVDPYRLLREATAWSLHPVTGGIIIGIALLVLTDLMFWRELFCTKACPYGMLQMVVTDGHTQIVRYQQEREQDCIDCLACVRACITGIDIRNSPYQTECIHCGDCVDACAGVLGKLGKKTLITFTRGQVEQRTGMQGRLGLADARRRIILGIIILFSAALVLLVNQRQPVFLSVSGDRFTLYRHAGEGLIANDYSFKITNRSVTNRYFLVSCGGEGNVAPDCKLELDRNPLFVEAGQTLNGRFSIITAGDGLRPGPNRLKLTVTDVEENQIRREAVIVFMMPEKM